MYKKKLISSKDNWETPYWLFDQLNSRFNFTVDVAAIENNCKVFSCLNPIFYNDGLKESWKNERVFCNPPFSQKDLWIKKAYEETINGECPLCIMILPSSVENKVYHEYIFNKNIYWEPLQGRVSFIDPRTKKPKLGNTHGTIIVYFWKKLRKF